MKPKTHYTHCALRLGDNLAHLHFLRKMAAAYPDDSFVHFAHSHYFPEMVSVIEDLGGRIELVPLGHSFPVWYKAAPPRGIQSLDAWKNAGGAWEEHSTRNDYVPFMLGHFARLSAAMGRNCPLYGAQDFLFDYPALAVPSVVKSSFLVVNSPPMSNQAPNYDVGDMDNLIRELCAAGHSVVVTHRNQKIPEVTCTKDFRCTVTGIGQISQAVDHILMVSTGPSWPTFNVWNTLTVKTRTIIIEAEHIGLSPRDRTVEVSSVSGARFSLKMKGLLS